MGGAGNDEIEGSGGDNTLVGGGGDNLLIGGPGANLLYGGVNAAFVTEEAATLAEPGAAGQFCDQQSRRHADAGQCRDPAFAGPGQSVIFGGSPSLNVAEAIR